MATTLEWWTDPATAADRLDKLTAQWTALERAAIGRGLTGALPYKQSPGWSDDLASHTGRAVQDFRDWRASIGGYEVISTWREALETWTHLANVLRDQLARLGGVPVAQLPPPLEEYGHVFDALGDAVSSAAAADLALAAFAFGVLVFLFGQHDTR